MIVGVSLGLVAGYYGGLAETVIMRVMDFATPSIRGFKHRHLEIQTPVTRLPLPIPGSAQPGDPAAMIATRTGVSVISDGSHSSQSACFNRIAVAQPGGEFGHIRETARFIHAEWFFG